MKTPPIPTIDVSSLATGLTYGSAQAFAVGQTINDTCRNIGFLLVVGHGVTPQTKAKLLAKMKIDGSGNEYAGQISGLTTSVADKGYPIDEFLSAAVPINDLFYVCVGGPATVITDTAGTTTVTPGLGVVPGAGTAGRVVAQDVSVAAGSATFNQVNNKVGFAISSVAAITTDLLIDVDRRI
jgi:hypothetical protein